MARYPREITTSSGRLLGTVCQLDGGYKFRPAAPNRRVSTRAWPSAKKCIPPWAQKELAND